MSGKSPRRPTFAEVVAEARAAVPAPPPAPPCPGWYDGEIVERDGTVWVRVERGISVAAAHRLVVAGARVVWDPCGCGGYCTPTWVDRAGLVAMTARRPDVPRDRDASFDHYADQRHGVLVVVSGDVSWAGVLA